MAIAEKMTPERRARIIKTASLIALLGNAALAIAKIVIGFFGHSLAVVGDGIDSSTDVAIAIMNIFVSTIITRPADKEHPWGHSRAETMGTTVLSFILFFAGGQLILTSIHTISEGEATAIPSALTLVVTVISMLGKTALSASQYALGKKAGSSILKANAINMRNDVLTSTGVLIGLGVSVGFKIPMADSITAILVGLWVLKSAVGVFMEVNLELMDGSQSQAQYQDIFLAVNSVPGVARPHRARMRRIASQWDIDLDIEVDGRMTVSQAHKLATDVENAIKARIDNVYDIMVHVEPAGEQDGRDGDEAFGLSESSLK